METIDMLYRDMGRTGDKVSVLGYGCLRFPKDGNKVDEARTERQVISAIEQGVNYFDTAYMYRGNEAILGNILSKGYRDKVMIATKIPPLQIRSRKDMDRILDLELEHLKTDHIDYYLMHMLSTYQGWQRLKELGVEDFLEKAKQAGKIRRICFSYHGGKDQFKTILDDYPWDMCQIQYNYMDEHNQAGVEGLDYAAAKGIGVVVMEPLRGGFLVNKLPPQALEVLNQAETKRSPAQWALRWVWNHPGVSTVLSGMNEESQIEENVRTAQEAVPLSLSETELAMFDKIRNILSETTKVGCTGCGYCMPCPAGVNIPLCFSSYNDRFIYQGKEKHQKLFYIGMTAGADGGKPSYASLCRDCGACETKCPQSLPIRRLLKDVSGEMEGFYFKPIAGFLQGYTKMRSRMRRKS